MNPEPCGWPHGSDCALSEEWNEQVRQLKQEIIKKDEQLKKYLERWNFEVIELRKQLHSSEIKLSERDRLLERFIRLK